MAANLKQKIKRGEQVVGFGIRGDIERDAFKRIAAGFSAADRDALFRGTASRVYRLD